MLICLQVMFFSALPVRPPPGCTLTAVVSKMAFLANRPGVCFNMDESGAVLGGVITTDEMSQWTWREGGGWEGEICLFAVAGSRLPESSLVSSDISQMASPAWAKPPVR